MKASKIVVCGQTTYTAMRTGKKVGDVIYASERRVIVMVG